MISLDLYPQMIQMMETASILDNRYKLLETIGQGRFAKVKLAIEIQTNKKFAIKIMRIQGFNQTKIESFINECRILSSVEQQNVIPISHVSINGVYRKKDGKIKRAIYYVMDIAEYGELFSIIDVTPNFPEKLARYYFKQLIQGIESLHKNNIAHRDIKTENILIDKQFCLKICDFGFAVEYEQEEEAFDSYELVGSPEFNPPEVSNPNYYGGTYVPEQMDLFQSAIVLFMMVMKTQPFPSTHKADQYYKLLCKNKKEFWKIYQCNKEPSIEFTDLIEKMLDEVPDKRISLEDIKSHPWFMGDLPTQPELEKEMKNRGDIIIEMQQERLKEYCNKAQKNSIQIQSNVPEIKSKKQLEGMLKKYRPIMDEINQKIKENHQKTQKKPDEKQLKEKDKKMNEDDQEYLQFQLSLIKEDNKQQSPQSPTKKSTTQKNPQLIKKEKKDFKK